MSKKAVLTALEEANINYIFALELVTEGYELVEEKVKIGRTRFYILRNKNGVTVFEKDAVILTLPAGFCHDYMAAVILTAMKY